MASDPWIITPVEFSQAESQFFSLYPQNGYLAGQQVRDHFVKSGLSPQILGQVLLVISIMFIKFQIFTDMGIIRC